MYIGTNELEKVYIGTTKLEKIYIGLNLIYESSHYGQQWSDDQPSQHNTPIPLDNVGLDGDVVSAVTTKEFDYIDYGNDSVGLDGSIVSAAVQDLG